MYAVQLAPGTTTPPIHFFATMCLTTSLGDRCSLNVTGAFVYTQYDAGGTCERRPFRLFPISVFVFVVISNPPSFSICNVCHALATAQILLLGNLGILVQIENG